MVPSVKHLVGFQIGPNSVNEPVRHFLPGQWKWKHIQLWPPKEMRGPDMLFPHTLMPRNAMEILR